MSGINTKKSRYVLYIEFMQPHNPEHIENQIRYAMDKKIIPPVRELMIGIDYKNMKPISQVPLVITNISEIEDT